MRKAIVEGFETMNAPSTQGLKGFQEYWQQTLHNADLIEYRKGQTLFYEGHQPCGLFVIVNGKIGLYENTTPSSRVRCGEIPHMIPFGIDLILADEPYPCSAVAEEESAAYFISKSKLEP